MSEHGWQILVSTIDLFIFAGFVYLAFIWNKMISHSANLKTRRNLRFLSWLFGAIGVSGFLLDIVHMALPERYYWIDFILMVPVLIFMLVLMIRIPTIKVWYQETMDSERMQAKVQRAEWEKNKLVSLVRDQEKSMRESSHVLSLISKTKKEIESGTYDDSFAS